MELFERALRKKLRFSSPVGMLSTEQLWDLPLIAKGDKPSLDNVARLASQELKELGEESFVEVKADPKKSDAELRLEVVKHVIAARQADAAKAEKAAETAQTKKALQEALAGKQADALKNMSEEDIKKKLAELDA